MRILGIADNHDASAALVEGGVVLAACSQERFDRRKNSSAFPWEAIESVLDTSGQRPENVDLVVLGTGFTPPWILRRLARVRNLDRPGHGQFTYLLNLYVMGQVAMRATGFSALDMRASRRLLARRLAQRGFNAPLELVDHHVAHAEAAWRSQPHDPCLVFTLDAMGDGLTCTVSEGRDGRLTRLWSQSGLASINTFYSRMTELLGFTPLRHEGKVMGLAAHATPPEPLLADLRRVLQFNGPGFSRTNLLYRQHTQDRHYRRLAHWIREELAAGTQVVFEEAVHALVAYWVKRTGHTHVALAGGAFANVSANRRISMIPGLESVWIYPNMGDGGLAVGGAWHHEPPVPARTPHSALGPGWSDSEMESRLKASGLPYRRFQDPEEEVARLLAAGRTVARFSGRMEWGPRALGNRSILHRPDDPSVNDWLNKRLRRTEFMPFAPAVLAEAAPEVFYDYAVLADAARFMTASFRCSAGFAAVAPGVVHLDGTARPQVVHQQDLPDFHRLIFAFQRLTGIPAVINTSFNLHEEPIVCTPDDAIRAWKQANLDALMLGCCLLERGGQA